MCLQEDDDEPLHVTVEGHSDEALEKAENLIQDLIDNPEKARAVSAFVFLFLLP